MNNYCEDDFLAISGIQHFSYCKRQWALIHIEKQWHENLRTIEGKQIHERVDNPYFFELRGEVLTARSVPVCSYTLCLYGVADMVEFYKTDAEGIELKGYEGRWVPSPVEYKRGKPKTDIIDEVQLCAQAICLEEMLGIKVNNGYIYYSETKHRVKVSIDSCLRDKVLKLSESMHIMYSRKITPKPEQEPSKCRNCSLKDVCLPEIYFKHKNVNSYIRKYIEEE